VNQLLNKKNFDNIKMLQGMYVKTAVRVTITAVITMSTTLRSATSSVSTKPHSNPPMRLSQTGIRLTRNSEKFVSNLSKCKCTNLPAEPISDLVSNQESSATMSYLSCPGDPHIQFC
jgi:hypothetical protein